MNQDTQIKTVNIMVDELFEKYKEIVNLRYLKLYEVDPIPFKMMNRDNVLAVYISIDPTKFADDDDYLFFLSKPNSTNHCEILNITDELYANHFRYSTKTGFHSYVIENLLGIESKDIISKLPVSRVMNYKNTETYLSELKFTIRTYSKILEDDIRDGLKEYHEHLSKPASYYAASAATYAYTQLDLSPIIEKVNNKDFTYQLDEAIAAYDNSLYTASATVLGVAIETMCVQILKNNSQKVKDSDATMIDKLADRLKENSLITRKEHGRLNVAYKVRNLASHSSPGKTIQADCHFLISVIHDMVETHF